MIFGTLYKTTGRSDDKLNYTLKISAVFALSVIGIPAISLGRMPDIQNVTCSVSATKSEAKSPETDTVSPGLSEEQFFSVLDIKSGQVSEIPVREYIIGAVCAEMPATFCEEALKAQAVASHTYALYQKMHSKNDSSLMGADFSNDPSKYQAFFNDSEIREYYGDNYEEYYGKVSDAVDEVCDMILVYEDEPIVAAFHSMSSGTTESAENIWGVNLSYLVPCDSSSDKNAPGYEEEYIFTPEEIKARIISKYEDAEFPSDTKKWFSEIQRSSSGTVTNLKAGSIQITGMEFRDLLSVRSAVFDICLTNDNNFSVTTHGYGHGVGMSQYGANSMAAEGKTCKQILEHYYRGTEIKSVQNHSFSK